jgi:hypothetical protein
MRPLKDLPHQTGFKFIGIDKDNKEHFCIIRLKRGIHVMNSNTVLYKDLIGWKEDKSNG